MITQTYREKPETSDHSSIKERITPTLNLTKAITETTEDQNPHHFDLPLIPLLNFDGNVVEADQAGLLFSLSDNLKPVDAPAEQLVTTSLAPFHFIYPPYWPD